VPIQRHNVVIPREDGGVEIHPLKEWLRQHPDTLPDMDPSSTTSHQLRSALCRLGWTMQEAPTEIRLIKPEPDLDPNAVKRIFGSDDPVDDADTSESPIFSLEYQLRDFLASNLGTVSIGGKRLRLYIDPTGRDGIEFPSAVGPIDILAVDDKGSFYVFELKRANGADRAMGQLARYMGWVKQTIGKGHSVYGVIVAKGISENLRYAASIVPNVHLFEYAVQFELKPAHDLVPA